MVVPVLVVPMIVVVIMAMVVVSLRVDDRGWRFLGCRLAASGDESEVTDGDHGNGKFGEESHEWGFVLERVVSWERGGK
ncbi:hypothetical protein GCM10023156_43670 [Novipirellula rosea]|uniref:Secreted protein n=1 Tax=Novipirellula rosea TaxID=1031540 RepID=A0ABP8N7N3_9BACT